MIPKILQNFFTYILIYYFVQDASTLVSATHGSDLIRISEKWYHEHGCPIEKKFFERDCNICWDCPKAGLKGGMCTAATCLTKTIDAYKPGDPCQSGLEFFSQCKFCRCNNNGTSAECNSTACKYYPQVAANKVAESESFNNNSALVRISEKWYSEHGCPIAKMFFKRDCNICWGCPKAGLKVGMCTAASCLTKTVDKFKSGDSCESGQEFFLKCKLCKCNDNGTDAECDDSACKYYPEFGITKTNHRKGSASKLVRVSKQWFLKHGCPHKSKPFEIDCNGCWGCPEIGSKYTACTLKRCHTEVIDDYKTGDVCVAKQEFFSQCKLCKCNDYGIDAECDDSACEYYFNIRVNETIPTTESVNNQSKLIRISKQWFHDYGCPYKNESFKVDCNHCWGCPEIGSIDALCKLEGCYTEVNDEFKSGDPCEARQEFFSQCKLCQCNDNGTDAACDDRACKYYPHVGAKKTTLSKESINYNTKLVKISKQWFHDHGCPYKNRPFQVDCRDCWGCPEVGSIDAACKLESCYTEVKDNYKSGDSCESEEEFFSQCKICKCNKNGTNAECDGSACKYYPKVKLE